MSLAEVDRDGEEFIKALIRAYYAVDSVPFPEMPEVELSIYTGETDGAR